MHILRGTSGELRGRFLRLSGPNIASNLLVPLASAIDIALLGHLAEVQDLAGVALGAILFDYVFWTFGFLRMATTGLTAQARGRGDLTGDLTGERLVVWRGLSIAAAAGLSILLLRGPLGSLGFSLMQGGEALHEVAGDYYRWRILGAPFTLANYVLLGWLLGREESGRALIMSAVGHGTNIVLDVLFIGGMGLGAAGAGAATAISQVVMFACAIGMGGAALRPPMQRQFIDQLLDRAALAAFFSLSRDIMIRTLLLVSTFAVFTNLAASMGTTVLAATAILRQVVIVAAWFIDGYAFAVESLVGVFHGSRESSMLRDTLRIAMNWAMGTTVLLVLFSVLIPGPLFGLLTDKPELLEVVMRYRWWLIPVLVFGAPAYILDGYFLGITSGRTLRVAMFWSTLLGFVPLAALAAWRGDADLLWASLAAFMLARTITLGRRAWATLPVV
ncbi:MATE family efflux transporter [bacterium]|nr:MAG: MATE family efflux transporter [bacterium]RKZ16481.1 MAG: MATE family efflux transporter [bacterium]